MENKDILSLGRLRIKRSVQILSKRLPHIQRVRNKLLVSPFLRLFNVRTRPETCLHEISYGKVATICQPASALTAM